MNNNNNEVDNLRRHARNGNVWAISKLASMFGAQDGGKKARRNHYKNNGRFYRAQQNRTNRNSNE